MKHTVLLTLGRLPAALEIARCLHAAGCRVIVADPFRWHICRVSRAVSRSYRVTAPNTDAAAFQAELLEIIRQEQVSLVLPISEEALHVGRLRSQLPPGVRLLCPDADSLLALHDKLRFAENATAARLPVPATAPADSAAGVALGEAGATVAKPAHSCSGMNIQRLAAGEKPRATTEDQLVQVLVEGDHISTLSLLEDGHEITTVMYRGLVQAGTVSVCFERVDQAPAVSEWVSRFAASSGLSGFFGFDFIVDAEGVAWAIECNPRITSGVHFLHPPDLARALLDPAAGERVRLRPQRRFQWAYSTLTEVYRAAFRPREFRRRFSALRRSRDVIWQGRDPLPFLLMTPLSLEILWPAMTSRVTLGEATQRDIAWLSPVIPPAAPPPVEGRDGRPGRKSALQDASSGAPQA